LRIGCVFQHLYLHFNAIYIGPWLWPKGSYIIRQLSSSVGGLLNDPRPKDLFSFSAFQPLNCEREMASEQERDAEKASQQVATSTSASDQNQTDCNNSPTSKSNNNHENRWTTHMPTCLSFYYFLFAYVNVNPSAGWLLSIAALPKGCRLLIKLLSEICSRCLICI